MHRLFSRAAACAALLATCASASAAGFYTQSGKIYDAAGQEVQVRGISHFGFNTEILQPQYLWQMGWKQQIAQIKALGFNAVRVPYAPDALYNTTTVDKLSYVDPNLNADLIGKTPLQVLDMWMAEASRQGLYIMLDFHSVSKYRQYPTWFVSNSADFNLIYNNQAYTRDHWIRDLKFVAARYASNPHFFAIDVFNEPNGAVRWSTGDPNMTNPAYFWKAAVESAAAGILASNPNLLIFVQGIAGNFDGIEDSNIPMNWGEDFQPQKYQPLNIAANKLVLTPHTYGPDVYMKSSFGASNFPANLPAHWEKLFGQFHPQIAVVPGEWGGRYGNGSGGQMDKTWQDAFVQWMVGKGMRNSFFWCYTPNSGDTGGILDDNLQVRNDKLNLIKQHWASSSGSTTTPPPATSFKLGASSYTVAQTAGSVRVYVQRVNSSGAVSVRYATANGTATSGTHYTATSGTLTWADGDATTKSFTVPVSNAYPFSGSKSFTVQLSTPSSGTSLASPYSASVTINGSAATASTTFKLGASSYAIAQTGGAVRIYVQRTGTSGAVSVKYATANGTATAGTHYTATSGTLTWAHGDATTKSFTVAVSNASPFSGSKSFTVQLSMPSSGTSLVSPSSATVTINGSVVATPGTLAWSPSSYTVSQSASSITLIVRRSGGSSGSVSVTYNTVDGTARYGRDYASRVNTLTWAAGDTSSRTVTIPILRTLPYLGNRWFSVRLSGPSGGASIGTGSATVSIQGSL